MATEEKRNPKGTQKDIKNKGKRKEVVRRVKGGKEKKE